MILITGLVRIWTILHIHCDQPVDAPFRFSLGWSLTSEEDRTINELDFNSGKILVPWTLAAISSATSAWVASSPSFPCLSRPRSHSRVWNLSLCTKQCLLWGVLRNWFIRFSAASETESPRRNISKAVRRVFYRILIFYVSLFFLYCRILMLNQLFLHRCSAR